MNWTFGWSASSDIGTLNFDLSSSGTSTLTFDVGSRTILDLFTPNTTDATFGGTTVGSGAYATWVAANATGLGTGSHDLLNVTGTAVDVLTFTGKLELRAAPGFAASLGQVFNVLDWSSVLSPTFASHFTAGGQSNGLSDNGTDFDLPDLNSGVTGLYWDLSVFSATGAVVVVPEPSRALMLLFGMLALLFRRRR